MLPPLRLYRAILQAHKKVLMPQERMLGDSYVRHEFKLHKDVTDGVILTKFFREWHDYLDILNGRLRLEQKLRPDLMDKLSDEQIGQLYELMKAIKEEQQGSGEGGQKQ